MKLRNKKTGEIVELESFQMRYSYRYDYGEGRSGEQPCSTYNKTLTELVEEWEDVPEEPKEYWYVDIDGEITPGDMEDDTVKDMRKIGNYFESEEEAKQAMEKLKAWKRLRDKGFRFCGWEDRNGSLDTIYFDVPSNNWETDICDDLVLLFGGEE